MITTIVEPTGEVISLLLVKKHLRVTWDHDDVLIESYIDSAIDHVEQMTNRFLLTRTVRQTSESICDRYLLEASPVQSVTSVSVTDTDDVTTTITDFEIDGDYLVFPDTVEFPALKDSPSAVTVEYVTGYASVPKSVTQAIMLLVSHFYENREAVGTSMKEIPMTTTALLSRYVNYL